MSKSNKFSKRTHEILEEYRFILEEKETRHEKLLLLEQLRIELLDKLESLSVIKKELLCHSKL